MTEAIGIDIGGTNIRAGRVSPDGRLLAVAKAPSAPDAAEVLRRCIDLIGRVTGPDVAAIGIGVPGQVHAATRRVLSGGYVDLSGIDLAGGIEAATGHPVTIENDATMAMLGEVACGAARGHGSVVMLTIGTGIGGAVLDRGRVLRGEGAAGQLGHIVIEAGGRPCACGRHGCIETLSSGTAFALHLAEAGLPAGTRVETLLARDDRVARAVVAAWANPLSRAIATLTSIFNPALVVIGGGAGAGAVAALGTVTAEPSWFAAPVVAAALGDDAGIIGAALTALGARPRPKSAVLVNGVPASGKSGVARAVADATGWPLLTLDTIKNPFLEELPAEFGPISRVQNRALGRASYAAMFALMRDAPPGSTFVLDAWFGFRPADVLAAGLSGAGVTEIVEIWCQAPPETIGARYGARVGERPPGHPGHDYVPELVALAERARPTGLAPVRDVDTTRPLDLAPLTGWIAANWAPCRPHP